MNTISSMIFGRADSNCFSFVKNNLENSHFKMDDLLDIVLKKHYFLSAKTDEGQTIERLRLEQSFSEDETITLANKRKAIIQEIKQIAQECSVEDYDGYDSLPLDTKSIDNAKKFIFMLPNNIPNPELDPEPSGELGLVWLTEKYHVSISINNKNNIAYAFTSKNGVLCGNAQFEDYIPVEILKLLQLLG